jgi:8-oxo-dGTP pyrophosphatase MutT (NUDIX family)
MLTFDQGAGRFNFRVAGLARRDNAVLVHRNIADDFWTLPGGRVEMGEPTADALAREMQEELGLAVTVGPLRWVIENFFVYDDKRCHEMGFYYDMVLPAGCRFMAEPGPFRIVEGATTFDFIWADASEANLAALPLYPAALRARAATLAASLEHLVWREA